MDYISQLPDDILCLIICLLSVDEAVRTSVLSKRWSGLWRFNSHLEFDGRRMIMPLTQRQNPEEAHDPYSPLSLNLNKGITRYGDTISSILDRHSGDLKSCRFIHFPYSIFCEEVVTWLSCVMGKNAKNVSLECEYFDIGTTQNCLRQLPLAERVSKPNFPTGIFSGLRSLQLVHYALRSLEPFKGCEKNLKTLILRNVSIDDETLEGLLKLLKGLESICLFECIGFRKFQMYNPILKVLQLHSMILDKVVVFAARLEVLHFDSIISPKAGMRIFSRSLRVIRCYDQSIYGSMISSNEGRPLLRSGRLLGHYQLFWGTKSNILLTLTKLSIDLDLHDILESTLVICFLQVCRRLETLEVTLPAVPDDEGLIDRCAFWQSQEACDCVKNQLKFVYLRVFKGNTQEFELLRHIAGNGKKLEKLTIVCGEEIETERMASLTSVAPNLSIVWKLQKHEDGQEIDELQERAMISYK
ncbi:F-box protein At1g80960-like [Prosopis cineraria]|uniref:F-box protein At1g80960-like n=1 Tax=Prosopis cineraria TaxID=364024 RepID=UPI00240F026C|nr:F-box protein At1g80960-like [Prosopis cineraria]